MRDGGAHHVTPAAIPVAMNRLFTGIAMATAGTMIAHQVAAKARDAAFLTAWPATALPLMTIVTAGATVALVPTFSRVLDRFPTVTVVAGGFALSAAVMPSSGRSSMPDGGWRSSSTCTSRR
jgi:hypothetical protein